MVPMEVGARSLPRETYDEEDNEMLIRVNLDLIEEHRKKAQLCITSYQQRMKKFFNSKVKNRDFVVGDLVLRKVMIHTKESNAGVLRPNWEGPYRITRVVRLGTYTKKTKLYIFAFQLH